ncbi:50S ribosomal protein L23 [Vulgatibacter incomptus]|uniref:Large ribosomal subunit protein uL23 n=1 Tax=Vulgatibacter incomptus TaxID=1391653 RepID=A0A0K1PDK8_9BACT|nr:50S ribosomal protein L23 [Vulgatibacter incomptus]AKU91587.1 LSU ribosomal protein L23p (L23Ae) [Vulgatibacter incomptus]
MNIHEVIRAPIVTEKSDQDRDAHNAFTFEVDRRASKDEIKAAVKKFFDVDAVDVRTSIVRGKTKRVGRSIGQRPNWKKAIVVLKEGQKIDLFDLGA